MVSVPKMVETFEYVVQREIFSIADYWIVKLDQVHPSKNSLWGIFWLRSIYHRVQHIKLCKNTNFQSSTANSIQVIEGNPIEDWGKVP